MENGEEMDESGRGREKEEAPGKEGCEGGFDAEDSRVIRVESRRKEEGLRVDEEVTREALLARLMASASSSHSLGC